MKTLLNTLKKEDGFSLIELCVAAGISATLGAVAMGTLIPAANHITENIKTAQEQTAANQQAELDFINSLATQ